MLSPQGFRTRIQAPLAEDEAAFLQAMRDSVGLHYPWVTAPKDHAGWVKYMARLERDTEAGFLVRHLDDNAICGIVSQGSEILLAFDESLFSFLPVGNIPQIRSRPFDPVLILQQDSGHLEKDDLPVFFYSAKFILLRDILHGLAQEAGIAELADVSGGFSLQN